MRGEEREAGKTHPKGSAGPCVAEGPWGGPISAGRTATLKEPNQAPLPAGRRRRRGGDRVGGCARGATTRGPLAGTRPSGVPSSFIGGASHAPSYRTQDQWM